MHVSSVQADLFVHGAVFLNSEESVAAKNPYPCGLIHPMKGKVGHQMDRFDPPSGAGMSEGRLKLPSDFSSADMLEVRYVGSDTGACRTVNFVVIV